jgi:hypothetical protein
MKSIRENLSEVVAAVAAETAAAPDGGAWTRADDARLLRLAMTGALSCTTILSFRFLGENPDHVLPVVQIRTGERKELEAALRILLRAPARALAAAAVRGRNEGLARAVPLLALVLLSLRDAALFREAFPRVVLTGGDLGDFLDLARRVRGLGRAVKSAVRDWLRGNVTPYAAQKYRCALADAIRLCHFRGGDPLCAWIAAARPGAKGATPERVAAAEAAYPALAARRDFIRAVEAGDEASAVRLLRNPALDLDGLSNWEGRYTPAIWRAAARRMPVGRFLRTMDKLRREGALEPETVMRKVTAANLRAAKVLPFRVYAAWKALWADVPANRALEAAFSAAGGADPLPSARETLAAAMEEHARGWDWGVLNRHSWCVAPCVSRRMEWPVGDSWGATCADVAAMFAAFLSVGLDRAGIMPWDRCVHPWSRTRHDTVAEHVRELSGRVRSRDVPRPSAVLEELIRRGADADCVLFLCADGLRDPDWLPTWRQYRLRRPGARAFILDLFSGGGEASEADEAPGVTRLAGWSDAVVSAIRLALEEPDAPDDAATPLLEIAPGKAAAMGGAAWADLLCRSPEYAFLCPWHLLRGSDWVRLLTVHPRFSDRCPDFHSWDGPRPPETRLSVSDWHALILANGRFGEMSGCPFSDFDREQWLSVLRLHPRLVSRYVAADRYAWRYPESRRLRPEDWAELVRLHPELAAWTDDVRLAVPRRASSRRRASRPPCCRLPRRQSARKRRKLRRDGSKEKRRRLLRRFHRA